MIFGAGSPAPNKNKGKERKHAMIITLFELAAVAIIVILVGFVFSKRIRNLITGKVDRKIDQMEQSDPDAIFRAAIKEKEDDISELRELSRLGKGLVNQKDEAILRVKNELDQVGADLKIAIGLKDTEMGPDLLAQKEALEAKLTQLEEEREELNKEADRTIQAKEASVRDLAVLKEEHQNADAAIRSEEILQKIRDRRDGTAHDATSKALQNARVRLSNAKAMRDSDKSEATSVYENKLAALRARGNGGGAAEKFASLIK